MSFYKAKACFKENLGLLPSQSKTREDSLLWNLNAGLHNLTEAMESDLSDLKSRLDRVEAILRQLR
jgi:hypothetical protein